MMATNHDNYGHNNVAVTSLSTLWPSLSCFVAVILQAFEVGTGFVKCVSSALMQRTVVSNLRFTYEQFATLLVYIVRRRRRVVVLATFQLLLHFLVVLFAYRSDDIYVRNILCFNSSVFCIKISVVIRRQFVCELFLGWIFFPKK